MTNHQAIVDEMRAALFSCAPANRSELEPLVAQYSEACRVVNERLQHSGDLLRRGLRSEAIQAAEIQPRLLDLCAALDFPERDSLDRLLVELKLPLPQRLQIEIAGDLNEAYAIEEPLQALLNQHRLLALAQAPLPERLRILRTIAETDTQNAVWQEDLVSYERERQRQIGAAVPVAMEARDLAALEELHSELANEPWRESPPAELVDRVVKSVGKIERKLARAELAELEPQLNEAHSAYDLAEARRIREVWSRAARRARLSPDHELLQRAAPALEWVEHCDAAEQQERDFAGALRNLEAGLDGDASALELERQYHAVEKFGQEIPSALESRLRRRLDALELEQVRRTRLRIVSVAMVLLIVAAATAWTLWQTMLARQVAAAAQSIQTLINEQRYPAADELIQRLESESPRVAASDEVQALKLRLSQLAQDEVNRASTFSRVMAEVGPPEAPVTDRFHQAQKLARTIAEKAQVAEFEIAVGRATRAAQKKRDEEFARQLEGMTARIAEVERDESVVPRSDRMDGLQQDLIALTGQAGLVSPSVARQAEPLRARLAAMRKDLERRAAQQTLLGDLTQSVGNRVRFAEMLQKFAQEYPESSRAADFSRIVEESTLWEAVDEWNQMTAEYPRRLDLDFKAAKQLHARISDLLEKHPHHPDAGQFRDRLPILSSIANRIKDDVSIEYQLQTLLADQLVISLWMVETDRGRFYTDKDPKLSFDQIGSFRYYTGFDKKLKTAAVQPGELRFQGPAPHTVLAKDLNRRLVDPKLTWESKYYQMIQTILNDTETDALFRLQLLDRTLDIACAGSYLLEQIFKPYRAALGNAKIDMFSNWLNPADDEAARNRTRAEELLRDLPPPKQLIAGVKTLQQLMDSTPGKRYEWIGWLQRGPGDQTTVACPKSPDGSGALVMIRRSGADPAISETIGRITSGKIALESLNPATVVEGRPVFLVRP